MTGAVLADLDEAVGVGKAAVGEVTIHWGGLCLVWNISNKQYITCCIGGFFSRSAGRTAAADALHE